MSDEEVPCFESDYHDFIPEIIVEDLIKRGKIHDRRDITATFWRFERNGAANKSG